MAFDTDGFFSPTIENFRGNIRKVPGYKPWFDFAAVLNRLGLDMLRDHDTPVDNQRLTATVLFVRMHQSFQAAILLTERGLLGDARVVLRSAVEGAIAMYGVADDPTFIQQLIHATYHNERKAARLLLNNADYISSCTAQQIADMNAAIERADKAESELGRKLTDIKWEQIAHKHCNDLYQLLYRPLSSAGTHTTLESINRYVSHDADMQITAVNVGPDTADMVATLKFACLTFLWAADPFARVFERKDMISNLQELNQQFARLPQEEPEDVAVIPNFRS